MYVTVRTATRRVRERERLIESNDRSRRRVAHIYRRALAAILIRMGTLFASTCV